MEAPPGCTNLLVVLQKVANLPIKVSPSTFSLDPTFFDKERSRKARKYWTITKYVLACASLFSLFRVIRLLRSWMENNHLQQICLYMTGFSMVNIALCALQTLETHISDIKYMMTAAWKLTRFQARGYSSRNWKMSLAYLLGSVMMIVVPSIYFVGAIVLDFHPVWLATLVILRGLRDYPLISMFCTVIMRILSSVVYTALACHGAGNVLFLLLCTALFGENIEIVSTRLKDGNSGAGLASSYHLPIRNRVHITRYRARSSVPSIPFTEGWTLYRQVRIPIRMVNQSCSNFIQALLIMGVIISTCSGYTIVMLHGDIPLTFYIPLALVFPAVIVVTFVMMTLASTPEENAAKFRQAWKLNLIRKIDKTRLASCPGIGYRFGFVENCKRKTALSTIDVVINLIASLTLLHP